MNDPAKMTSGFSDFQTNMGGGIDYSFNWFYVDSAHIGYQHSCKCPQRATGVDPYMPAWGTGAWDWTGYIPLASQPNVLDPAQGYITSWNNKQAPDFMADDRGYSQGPVQRVQMLNTRIEAAITAGPIDRADLVDAMEDAGTVDLRGQEVLPLLLDVMGPTAPGGLDARTQDMRDRLATWAAADAHRRDLDHDGAYDDPQPPAIMDKWWSLLSHDIFDPDSGNAISNLGISLNDAPQGHNGSAFGGGTYSHVQKDLRQVLGLSVTDPFSRTYCGSGNLAACATVLWTALSDAAPLLQTEFASATVADWKRTVASDEVRSSAIGIATASPFHWINRPTFQQVVEIGTACTDDSDCDGVLTASDNCPMAPNPSQDNTDRNFIDQTPPSSQDDRTWPNSDAAGDACDPDDDNDGLTDTAETGGPPCASAAAATDPLLRDSDGDRVLDGAECALETDPTSSTTKPTQAMCGANVDSDGDRLKEWAEFCGYNTSDSNTDTDGDLALDGANDGCEAASLNGDRVVNSGDQLLMVIEILRELSPSLRLVSYDINKDGAVNAGDQLLLAQFISPSGQCP